ncbi:MAG: hypothetical protein AVDCRST_MAG05-171, partial [uncultured Rubrobacteraceae bacterium]
CRRAEPPVSCGREGSRYRWRRRSRRHWCASGRG